MAIGISQEQARKKSNALPDEERDKVKALEEEVRKLKVKTSQKEGQDTRQTC